MKGSLQDRGRHITVGQKLFGKGKTFNLKLCPGVLAEYPFPYDQISHGPPPMLYVSCPDSNSILSLPKTSLRYRAVAIHVRQAPTLNKILLFVKFHF